MPDQDLIASENRKEIYKVLNQLTANHRIVFTFVVMCISSFDDSTWPSATTYTNIVIGVDNKPSYTNFVNIFDDATNDAQFIWSKNVILDNEVIVRKTVNSLSVNQNLLNESKINMYPNPTKNEIHLDIDETIQNEIQKISFYNVLGIEVFSSNKYEQTIPLSNISSGMYVVKIKASKAEISKKLIVE